MTTQHRNHIDDILVGVTPKEIEFPEEKAEVESPEAEELSEAQATPIEETKAEETSESKPARELKEESKTNDDTSSDEDLDEYGNAVDKPKMYSEEQVQMMIRDRLARGQHQPQQQAQIQKAAEDFKADPNSEEPWEVQLENFVEKTIDKVTTKKQTLEWQQREQQAQSEFESKFTTSMQRYKDFSQVTQNLPITDAMMAAASSVRELFDSHILGFLYQHCLPLMA